MVPLAIPLFHCAKSLTTFVFCSYSAAIPNFTAAMDRAAKKKNAGIETGKDTDFEDLQRHFQSESGFLTHQMCYIMHKKGLRKVDFDKLGSDATLPFPSHSWVYTEHGRRRTDGKLSAI